MAVLPRCRVPALHAGRKSEPPRPLDLMLVRLREVPPNALHHL
eukprot:CAMPEP_0168403940 /NCGR_PEP_ID=MMETSP0228-20121227/24385_1 /TAXON_ID=133427 /ORGANISM="Protoceratium reticulatum, Strain CCCM 535 (=CCMP 1889)" /LENGTH=42 /DNA_ID= /DNA_START= /DNA_END= /DNA_ORIENTATION=